jgi:hypothetical protein
METKLLTWLGGVELGGSDEKFVPTNICKKGGKFGGSDIIYPLLSI